MTPPAPSRMGLSTGVIASTTWLRNASCCAEGNRAGHQPRLDEGPVRVGARSGRDPGTRRATDACGPARKCLDQPGWIEGANVVTPERGRRERGPARDRGTRRGGRRTGRWRRLRGGRDNGRRLARRSATEVQSHGEGDRAEAERNQDRHAEGAVTVGRGPGRPGQSRMARRREDRRRSERPWHHLRAGLATVGPTVAGTELTNRPVDSLAGGASLWAGADNETLLPAAARCPGALVARRPAAGETGRRWKARNSQCDPKEDAGRQAFIWSDSRLGFHPHAQHLQWTTGCQLASEPDHSRLSPPFGLPLA